MPNGLEISYRRRGRHWEGLVSNGERIIAADDDELDLDGVRSAVRDQLANQLDVAPDDLDGCLAAEYVQVPDLDGVQWHGLRSVHCAPDFDLDQPSKHQQRQLRQCYEYYRRNVPEGMRVELYGNRVRLEPGAFGQRRAALDGLAGVLAGKLPDTCDLVPGPVASGLAAASEQYRRAQLLDVPVGFVRVSTRIEGWEDEGDLGVIHLLLKERWEQDRPW